MKAVDAIRLFFPLILGATISFIFAFYLLYKFDNYSDSFTATKSDYERLEDKFSGLSGNAKIGITEKIISEDLFCGKTFQNAFENYKKIISEITNCIAIFIIIQCLVLLSYFNLERKTSNPINNNGIRVVVFTNIFFVSASAYMVLAKVGDPLGLKDKAGILLGGVFVLFLVWKIYKRSIYAAWAYMLLVFINVSLVLLDKEYQYVSAIHIYIALEAIISVYGLQKET